MRLLSIILFFLISSSAFGQEAPSTWNKMNEQEKIDYYDTYSKLQEMENARDLYCSMAKLKDINPKAIAEADKDCKYLTLVLPNMRKGFEGKFPDAPR